MVVDEEIPVGPKSNNFKKLSILADILNLRNTCISKSNITAMKLSQDIGIIFDIGYISIYQSPVESMEMRLKKHCSLDTNAIILTTAMSYY